MPADRFTILYSIRNIFGHVISEVKTRSIHHGPSLMADWKIKFKTTKSASVL